MTGVGFAATGIIDSPHIKKGDPRVLLHAMDYLGNLCGSTNYIDATNSNIVDKPKAYMLKVGINVCVEACPDEMDLTKYHCKYNVEATISEETESTRVKKGDEAANLKQQQLYAYHTSINECLPLVKTTSYMGYCIPNVVSNNLAEKMNAKYDTYNITASTNLTVTKDAMSNGEFFDEAVADTYIARNVILAFGFGGAMILGFLFLLLLRVPGTTLILVHLFKLFREPPVIINHSSCPPWYRTFSYSRVEYYLCNFWGFGCWRVFYDGNK